uniref:Phosphatidylinositol-specific phospholipase C X domain-containing protein n=1 Tax=Oryza nivara TaxID=4536 RepID=A0A0E0IW53_ORYNI
MARKDLFVGRGKKMGGTFTAAPALALVLLVALSVAATANVGESCSTAADCGGGQWCFDCQPEFAGSSCVRSAATNPFQLTNNSLPFNKYAYLTTHNSFAIVGEPSHTGVPRITFDNQEDTVTDQLNNGVRALMLDTYDFKGDVWLCHSNGGKCNDFTAFEPALDTFKEIEAFLGANPSEIVTLILEDYVHAPNGLTNVFKASGLMKYWFPVSKMPQKDGDDGMDAGKCSNRAESAPLNDKTKSLVLVNYFPSVPVKVTACLQHSKSLTDMVNTCYGAAGNRWANFLAVDYYKRSDGGGAFQATDLLNGRLLCGCQDVKACSRGSGVICSS